MMLLFVDTMKFMNHDKMRKLINQFCMPPFFTGEEETYLLVGDDGELLKINPNSGRILEDSNSGSSQVSFDSLDVLMTPSGMQLFWVDRRQGNIMFRPYDSDSGDGTRRKKREADPIALVGRLFLIEHRIKVLLNKHIN